ncbi:MAG TPA: hypothetical protein VG273_26570 [Bryobacteraceae bacterium]|jgi:hypothetical protein|nr:hypothetical protein [Bryobacteraceae bacterium]
MKQFVVFFCLCGLVLPRLPLMAQTELVSRATDINITSTVLQPSVKRPGINLGDMNYYDSGQLTKNLISRNPGFEGEIYQSTIRCASGSATTCVDDDAVSAWPDGFWSHAAFEIFFGNARGRKGTIATYKAAGKGVGGTFTLSGAGASPASGDYMIVRMNVPGNGTAGWWLKTTGNAAIKTNRSDLPPDTAGRQTAAVRASSAKDSATLSAYFDSHAGKSFLLLSGTFQLSFKAKGLAGSKAVGVILKRNGLAEYLNETVQLTGSWATYNLTFAASETGSAQQSVALQFATVGQDSFLLDDVSLTQTDSDPSNTTAFRDGVVNTLQTLQPGTLRLWAGQLGDTLDNLIAEPNGRQRSGYLAWFTRQEDISYGLHEFLQLCAAIGAEPWFVIPSTFSLRDAANLIEYLAGPDSTPYGTKRAARGNAQPWTEVFSRIHLEFGNEAWNGQFKGGSIEYPAPYGKRAQAIFAAMRGSTFYQRNVFDLILGGQAVSAPRNLDIQNNCNNNDSFTIAPYMMNTVDSFTSTEALFGSTFAEPEAYFSSAGTAEGVTGGLVRLNQKALANSSHPVPLTVYEINLSTLSGSITQAALNSYVSSLGAGLAVADGMLQMMRHGVLLQNLWNLSQYNFARPDKKNAFLWGAVIDFDVMNRRRPQYLALQLINEAIGKDAALLQTIQSGADPTWNQPLVNTVRLAGAHYLQSYAFSSGTAYSLIVLNLHRTDSLPVTFSGPNAPSGTVQAEMLTSASPSDTNEEADVVHINGETLEPGSTQPLLLPPNSMTLLTWGEPQ